MKQPRTSNQKRSSTTIAIGFVILVGAIWEGSNLYTQYSLRNQTFQPVTPGRVNIVGIDPGAGYKIIVANQMAQLVQATGGFGGTESGGGGATEGAIKKRIPIKELLEVIHGDSKAVGPFVMNLNGLSENDLPPIRVVWTAENLNKAFKGDQALKTKLESDLNVHLDGTPLPTLRIGALQNGIVLDYPVVVKVNVDGQVKSVTGRIQEAYLPAFSQIVQAQYKDKQVTQDDIVGYYATEAADLKTNPRLSSDCEQAIKGHIDPKNAQQLADVANQVLASAVVVVSDKYITSATHQSYDTNAGKMYDLTFNLNDEGRRRLWKYSVDRIGSPLLLVSDGIPIAAPMIKFQLSQGELTVTQMEDEQLVKDAEAILNGKPNGDVQ